MKSLIELNNTRKKQMIKEKITNEENQYIQYHTYVSLYLMKNCFFDNYITPTTTNSSHLHHHRQHLLVLHAIDTNTYNSM